MIDVLVLGVLYVVLHATAARLRHRGGTDADGRGAVRRRPRRLPVRLAVLGLAVVAAGAPAIVAVNPARPAGADTVCPGEVRQLAAYDYESVTVAATAIGFTASKIASGSNSADAVKVTVETAQIRYRYDGTNPTAAEGHPAEPGDAFWVCGTAVSAFKAIRTGGTSGVLKATFHRRG